MTYRLPTTAIVLCFFSCAASAGTWQIDSTSAAAGASISIPITLAGDGETVVGELEVAFDDGRLTLPVASGHISGASVNGGICIRTSSNRLKVISNLLASTPIPTRPSIICNIPFTVLNLSAPGKAPVSAIKPHCSACTARARPTMQCLPPRKRRPRWCVIPLQATTQRPESQGTRSIDTQAFLLKAEHQHRPPEHAPISWKYR